MSDEEDEVEVEAYARRYHSVQQPEEPLAEAPKAIGFCQAFCLPGVLPVSESDVTFCSFNGLMMSCFSWCFCFVIPQYSLAYACLKLVNYSFFFWLPFYLSNNFNWKEAEADRLSVWYDVGGIIGKAMSFIFSDFWINPIWLLLWNI